MLLTYRFWFLLIIGRYSAAGREGMLWRGFGTRGSGMKQGYTLKYDSGGADVEHGRSRTLVCCNLTGEVKQNGYLHLSVIVCTSSQL